MGARDTYYVGGISYSKSLINRNVLGPLTCSAQKHIFLAHRAIVIAYSPPAVSRLAVPISPVAWYEGEHSQKLAGQWEKGTAMWWNTCHQMHRISLINLLQPSEAANRPTGSVLLNHPFCTYDANFNFSKSSLGMSITTIVDIIR